MSKTRWTDNRIVDMAEKQTVTLRFSIICQGRTTVGMCCNLLHHGQSITKCCLLTTLLMYLSRPLGVLLFHIN